MLSNRYQALCWTQDGASLPKHLGIDLKIFGVFAVARSRGDAYDQGIEAVHGRPLTDRQEALWPQKEKGSPRETVSL